MRRGDVKTTCTLALILALLSGHAFHGLFHSDSHQHDAGVPTFVAGSGAAARHAEDEHASGRCPVCEFLKHSRACTSSPGRALGRAPAEAHRPELAPVVRARHRLAPYGTRAPPPRRIDAA